MANGGIKQSWRNMLKFFSDKDWRNQSWEEAKSNFNGSYTGKALSSLVDKVTGSDLTAADRAQNEFNAAEAEKQRDWSSAESAAQRDWSSQEAEIARDWQEEMYYKYNSLSGKIAQAEDAGVNPMFAVTGNSVSPMTTSSPLPSSGIPSGASAHGGNPTTESFVNLIGQIAGLVKLKSEVNLMDSEANRNNADAEKTSKEASWVDYLSQAQLDNLVASKDELESRLGVNSETANKLKAEFSKLVQETSRISQLTSVEKRKIEAEAIFTEWTNENREWLVAADIGAEVLSSVTNIATSIIENKTKIKLKGIPQIK